MPKDNSEPVSKPASSDPSFNNQRRVGTSWFRNRLVPTLLSTTKEGSELDYFPVHPQKILSKRQEWEFILLY